jgi:hypothetical protein
MCANRLKPSELLIAADWSPLGMDDRDSFLAAFAEDNHDTGKAIFSSVTPISTVRLLTTAHVLPSGGTESAAAAFRFR